MHNKYQLQEGEHFEHRTTKVLYKNSISMLIITTKLSDFCTLFGMLLGGRGHRRSWAVILSAIEI